MVHAETSTGVLNPVAELCRIAKARGAMTIVDAVTSLGAHPVDARRWGADVVYSCSQKGLGAPSGLAPVDVLARRALPAEAGSCLQIESDPSTSISSCCEDYWVDRKYHHTISAPLVYALHEALVAVEEEGLEARWERHRVNHLALVDALAALGLRAAAAAGGAAVVAERRQGAGGRGRSRRPQGACCSDHAIEIGAGLGPLAGKIWRVGLMGSGSTQENITRLAERAAQAARGDEGDAARLRAIGRGSRLLARRLRRRRLRLPVPARRARCCATQNPATTAFMELRAREAHAQREAGARSDQRWVPYARISANLKRAVIVTEDSAFWQHEGVDYEQLRESMEVNWERGEFARGASTITQQLAKNLYLSPSKNPMRKLRGAADHAPARGGALRSSGSSRST